MHRYLKYHYSCIQPSPGSLPEFMNGTKDVVQHEEGVFVTKVVKLLGAYYNTIHHFHPPPPPTSLPKLSENSGSESTNKTNTFSDSSGMMNLPPFPQVNQD